MFALEEEPGADQEDEGDEATDEEVFLGREEQRGRHAGGVEPLPLGGRQVAEHADDQQQREEVDVDVVADEAREVQKRRRDGEQDGGGDGAVAAELVPQQKRQADDPDAEQRRHQARGEVAGAEEQKDQRVQLEQQRPVHHRVVDVALAVEEAPRIEGVQALVVVERLGAQVPEAQDQADEHQPEERQILGVDRNLDRVAPPALRGRRLWLG